MSLTRAAIEKNRITGIAMVVIVMAGISAFNGMPQNEDPGFIIRTAQVLTFFPGASPERVELLVSDKLEEVIQEIPQLDFVNSTSRDGVSEVFVNILESEKVMRPIWDDLRRKIERGSRNLPAGVIGPIVNDEFGDVFGTVVALIGEGYTYSELKEVADQVRNELLKIGDAAKVTIKGAQEEHIFVQYNNARLAELGLSASQLKNILSAQNILLPGGSVNTGDERIILEPSGNFESVEDLRRTVISVPGLSGLVYLQDIAQIYRGYVDPPTEIVRSGGIPALVLGVSLREGGNLITLGDEVMATLTTLQERYPIGIEFDVIYFQPEIVEKKVDAFVSNLIQAIVIVLIVDAGQPWRSHGSCCFLADSDDDGDEHLGDDDFRYRSGSDVSFRPDHLAWPLGG
jgi:multidrug efflux pump